MNELCVFAVKRGDVEKRFDPHANHPKFQAIFSSLKKYTILPLSDYAECIFSGMTPKSGGDAYTESEEGILFIKSGGLSNDGRLTIDPTSKIKSDIHNRLMKSSKLKKNDVLIAIVGATIGKVGLFDLDCEANINQAIAAIRLKDTILPEFLVAYMLSPFGQAYLEYLKRPVARANINLQEIGEIGIPCLSIQQQKSFANTVFSARNKKAQKIRQAEELLSSMSAYIFDVLKLSKINYEERIFGVVTLSDIMADKTFSAEYYHPERMAALHSLKSNISMNATRLSNVVSFHRDTVSSVNNTNYLGLAGVESQTGELSGVQEEAAGQAFAYEKNDVLYGRLRPYLNKVLLAESDGICSTEFHVMRVIDTTTVLPEYVAAILRSDLILSQTRHMMTGNTHPRISNDDVQNLYIPVPDISVQIQIADDLRKRRIEARKLKWEAEQEWQAAKEQFERELLGE